MLSHKRPQCVPHNHADLAYNSRLMKKLKAFRLTAAGPPPTAREEIFSSSVAVHTTDLQQLLQGLDFLVGYWVSTDRDSTGQAVLSQKWKWRIFSG